jgi:16S rRNA G966 N2-methylase RsmD
LEETLAALKTAEVLAPGCRIIAEHAANLPPETPPGFTLCDRRKYGTAGLSIFEEERA